MAGATYVPEVDYVHEVGCVKWVEGLDVVIPPGMFPDKENNYAEGGRLDIPAEAQTYTAAYIPDTDCQLKSLTIAFSAYNLEDTFDVMIGDRYIIRNSPTVEMTDRKSLDVYEDVEAGTPIVIAFHNNSSTRKMMFYTIYTLTDEKKTQSLESFNWNFYWSGYDTLVPEDGSHSHTVDSPNYLNSMNAIEELEVIVGGLQIQQEICRITWDETKGAISNYIETDPYYEAFKPLARDRNIILTDIVVSDDHHGSRRKISFVFENVKPTETGVNTDRIGMDLRGTVKSRYK